jgi:hypothetical protein
MIGDIIEMARAKAALGDVAQLRTGADAAGCGIGPEPEHDNIRAGEGSEAPNGPRWGWASLARMAAMLLPASV